MRNKMSAMTEVAKENMRVQQDRQKYYYDKKSRIRSYSVGDKVLILHKVVKMEKIQLRLVAPHDKQTIDMGDMCPKYLVAWKHTSLTWFLEHH
jgi:hypothetical protein